MTRQQAALPDYWDSDFRKEFCFPLCNDTGSGTHPALWSTVHCVSGGGGYFAVIKRLEHEAGRSLTSQCVELYLHHFAIRQWRGSETQGQISVGRAGLSYLVDQMQKLNSSGYTALLVAS